MKASTTIRLLAAVASVSLLTVACSDDKKDSSGTTAAPTTEATAGTETTVPTTDAPSPYAGNLVGTFSIDAGDCTGAAPAGSYFQMVNVGGTPEAGPFIPNADSSCADKNFTSLTAGTDGGLITGSAQAAPDPAFDATGNGLAGLITTPVKFFGVAFAIATDAAGAIPTITGTADGTLTGDLSAFTAYYGTGIFNQGAPKPDGTGTAPIGTIDPATGHYTLTWSSLISGGSFNGFTGVWHLEGTFTPKA